MLDGDLGRAVVKISVVAPQHHTVRAKARIFHTQEEVETAFHAREERCPIDPPMLGTANSANPAVTTTGPKVRGSLAP
jgi:hypothetical protein